MFGSDKVNGLNSNITPAPLAVLCYNSRVGFVGDEIGSTGKFCNDFFPTPSDLGICLTKNLDIKEIISIKKEYNNLFEPKSQKHAKKIDGGTTWGGISLILLPEEKKIFTVQSPESEGKNLKIQLHPDNEFANMLKTNDYDDSIIPLSLEPNHEYFIKVTPYGRRSSQNIMDMNIEQRNCRLVNEVIKGSIFKTYTESNCRYECHTKLASKMCKCAPWDFIHNSGEKECDVFGRTCFYQTLKNMTRDSHDHCSQCIQGCDYMQYKREIIKSTKVRKENHDLGNEYFHCTDQFYTKVNCKGEKSFVEFFYDTNDTFLDKGFYNMQDSGANQVGGYAKYQRAKMYKNVIIVHLTFMKPEIEFIDVKYTFMDKIANFGGKFGIFAQLTGWSFIGIINLCIVLLKCPFTTRN